MSGTDTGNERLIVLVYDRDATVTDMLLGWGDGVLCKDEAVSVEEARRKALTVAQCEGVGQAQVFEIVKVIERRTFSFKPEIDKVD